MIDLHCHSTASDGSLTPTELVTHAERAGLSALALTDHDTMAGVPEFLEAGQKSPVRTLPGVEVGVRWYGINLHLVGLFVNPNSPTLRKLLAGIRDARTERNRTMLQRLNDLGMAVSLPEQCAGSECVFGRPHMAHALVQAGYCKTAREAFDRYLARGGPAFVRRKLPLPSEAIGAIHAAGGVATWAHPLGHSGRPTNRLRKIARNLRARGLDALGVYYSDYTPGQHALAAKTASELGLLPAGGSDFHGEVLPDIALGVGFGDLAIPDDILPPLEARAREHANGH